MGLSKAHSLEEPYDGSGIQASGFGDEGSSLRLSTLRLGFRFAHLGFTVQALRSRAWDLGCGGFGFSTTATTSRSLPALRLGFRVQGLKV